MPSGMTDGPSGNALLQQLSGLTAEQCSEIAADVTLSAVRGYGYTGAINIFLRALALVAVNSVVTGAVSSPDKIRAELLEGFGAIFDEFMKDALEQIAPRRRGDRHCPAG